MLKNLEQMKIKKRLIFGYVVVIVLMILSGIFSIVGMTTLYSKMMHYVNGSQVADTAVKICRIDVNIAARTIREMTLNEDMDAMEGYKKTIDTNINEIEAQLEILEGTGLIEDELYTRYEASLNEWIDIGYQIIAELEAGDRAAAKDMILNDCAPALMKSVAIAKEIDLQTDMMKHDAVKSSKLAGWTGIILIIVFIGIALGVSMVISRVVVKSILIPIREVERVANELSAGNLHSKLDYCSDDEIGSLAQSLRQSIEILGSYVDDIDRAMNEFSKGNFDVQPAVEWKGDFVGILNAFLMFERSMAETVIGIHSVADQVKNGSEQVAASSLELAQGATDQAAITEELTATLESISDQIAFNAGNAKNISDKVAHVGEEIIRSNGKMQEMVTSMEEINNSSAEISKIIAAINDIASQTNLLALNASIEAARAGEAGKGFAVVADQVSLLASQSADAAKESTVLIESSVRAVKKGMVIADDTAKELNDVVAGSKIITEKVNEVADTLQQQSESIAQIRDGVNQINDVVQTNSATSEECAAASQEMNSQANALEDMISKFKIGQFEK